MKGFIAGLLLLLLAGCGLPDRDNRYDPANAPVADLEYFDATDGGCSAATVGTALESIILIERGRCLGLSGLGSTDPQDGRPVGFRFVRLDGEVEEDLSGGFVDSPVLVLDREAVRELPSGVPLVFRLWVKDSAGAKVSAEREIQVQNAEPTVARVSSMTIPFGGYPWATESLDVRFESPVAIDPNGDLIDRYVWTFEDGSSEESSDPLSPLFTRSLDVSVNRPYRATFRAEDDQGLTTPTQTVLVNRGPPNIWLSSGQGFSRIDSYRDELNFIGVNGQIRSRYVEPSGVGPLLVAVFERAADRGVLVFPWPDLSFPAAGSLPAGPGNWSLALSPSGDQLAVIDTTGSTGTVHRFTYDGTAVGPVTTTAVTMPTEGVGLTPSVESALGAIWVSRQHENLYAIDSSTGLISDTFTDTLPIQDLAVRPGSGELWVARSVELDEAVSETARLHRFTGVAPPQVIETGKSQVRAIAWADGNDLWVVLDDETLLVDAGALEAGAAFESAIVVRAPSSPDVFHAFTDLSSGDVIVETLTGPMMRVRRDGSTGTVFAARPGTFAEYTDGQGALWSTTATSLLRSGPAGAVSPVTPFVSAAGGGPDGQGGLWLAGGSIFGPTASILRVGEDGTIARRHETMIVDGVEIPIPAMRTFRVHPGSPVAWAHAGIPLVSSLGVYRIDLATAPPVATLVLDSTVSGQLDLAAIMEPSSPTAPAPFTWMLGPGETIWQVSNDGQVTPAENPLFGGPQDHTAARSIVSNGLCVGSMDNSDDFFRGRWIPASSPPTQTLLLGVAVPTGSGIGPTAVSRDDDGTGDICWYSYQEPPSGPCTFGATQIRAYYAGTTTQALTYTPPTAVRGRIRGIRPFDTNRFWLLMERCSATGEPMLHVDLVLRAPTGALEIAESFPLDAADRQFVEWEASPPP